MAYEHTTPVHFDCSTNVQRCTGAGFERVVHHLTRRVRAGGFIQTGKALVPCPISGMRSEGSLVVRPDRRQNFCLIIQLTLYGWIASKLAGKVSGSPFA